MKIELKSISLIDGLSEETACYNASLWVDGQRIGTVGNHGTCGADEFQGDQAAFDCADAWCKANLPKWSLFDEEATHETDLEMLCAQIVARFEGMRHIKRALARDVLFQKPDDPGIYAIKPKAPHKSSDPRIHAQVAARHPGAVILNALPADQAYTLYSE